MVFRIENEVGADNGDADGDDHEDEEDKERETEDVVDLVRPERREDEVHFDKDAAKREESTQQNHN